MNPYRWLKQAEASQLLALVLLIIILVAIADKWRHDILWLIQNNPGDFWGSFGRYILGNISGG
jgi:hypothetical protein